MLSGIRREHKLLGYNSTGTQEHRNTFTFVNGSEKLIIDLDSTPDQH